MAGPEKKQDSSKPREIKPLGKITVAKFIDITGGISNLDRKAVINKFKLTEKSSKEWTSILTKATILSPKKG